MYGLRSALPPVISVFVEVPTRPDDIARRHHNQFGKRAMMQVLKTHHATRIPMHFVKSARQRYGYKPRTLKYMKWKNKRFHSSRDLVKTGDSEREMKNNPKFSVGGAAEGGKKALEGTLSLRFKFTGGSGRFYRNTPDVNRVTIEQMHKEVRATTDDERHQMAIEFHEAYWAQVQAFRGRRKRKRNPRK